MASTRKGEYVRSFRDTINNTIIHVFKYRGHEYEIIDSGWKGGQQPAYAQHRMEQDHIDELISREEKMKNFKGEDSQIGFDLFWKYVNGEDL